MLKRTPQTGAAAWLKEVEKNVKTRETNDNDNDDDDDNDDNVSN